MAVHENQFEIPIEQLRWTCDPSTLGFTCTDELQPPEGFIGQDRAVAALEFGLGVEQGGFNIFATGMTGTGRTAVIRTHLEHMVRKRADQFNGVKLYDWCYLYNFTYPDRPRAVRLERGDGRSLSNALEDLLEQLKKDLQAAFKNDAYLEQARQLGKRLNDQRQQIYREAERKANEHGFALQPSSAGISIVPTRDGQPLDQETLSQMDEEERRELEQRRAQVGEIVGESMRRVQQLESEFSQQAMDLDRSVAERTITGPIEAVKQQFSESEVVQEFLDGLREYTLHHLQAFFSDQNQDESGADQRMAATIRPGQSRDPFLPFQVNLFVDNAGATHPPIIVEENPTYANLFGQIDRRPFMGTYLTDHMMVRSGSILRANGGYLVVRARDVFRYPGVWEGLKRALRSGEIRPEDPSELFFPGFLPQALRPDPIQLEVKLVMTGDAFVYHLLSALDEEFWEIFKVRADFDSQMDNTESHVGDYAALICQMVDSYGLRHFDHTAVGAIVEHGARMVSDRDKLTTRFGQIADVMVEASEWAQQDGAERVGAAHVQKAVEQRVYRSSLIADRIRELMVRGTLMVDLEGAEVGQVNGLSVYNIGDISFGRPSRITASTYMGRPGVVNIEREAKLSGSTHDKGVLIMSGYLGRTFAQKHPLNVAISLAFEQSYSGIDGDSASSTELYAILSSLSDVPIKQWIAVTGSVNQLGEIQPIGGVNEKIEGFHDVCKEAGKLGPDVGVMIPKSNVSNLMLRPDVVESIQNGGFRIYAVSTVNEGVSILTGRDAGEADREGNFPEDSVNYLVAKRLRELAEGMKAFSANGSGESSTG